MSEIQVNGALLLQVAQRVAAIDERTVAMKQDIDELKRDLGAVTPLAREAHGVAQRAERDIEILRGRAWSGIFALLGLAAKVIWDLVERR
ncbi:MAG: hypothetical protein RDU89_07080 [bacterium]|nr:hypothetical protein [bacterium]